jgi:hypothetical protein
MTNILSIAGDSTKYKLSSTNQPGFLAGFWHGLILPISVLIILYNPNVSIF